MLAETRALIEESVRVVASARAENARQRAELAVLRAQPKFIL